VYKAIFAPTNMEALVSARRYRAKYRDKEDVSGRIHPALRTT
jgi:hypothetical protein